MAAGKGGSSTVVKLDAGELNEHFMREYKGQVFRTGQQLAMNCLGQKLDVIVEGMEFAEVGSTAMETPGNVGLIVSNVTSISFSKRSGSTSPIAIVGGSTGSGGQENLFRSGFDFEQMGIGGLGAEFQKIFRRAFASRMYPTSLVKEMGFSHVKGILLYGPPGCGKVRSFDYCWVYWRVIVISYRL